MENYYYVIITGICIIAIMLYVLLVVLCEEPSLLDCYFNYFNYNLISTSVPLDTVENSDSESEISSVPLMVIDQPNRRDLVQV